MKKLILFALAGVLALSGCKKDPDQEPGIPVITVTFGYGLAWMGLAGSGQATIDWGNGDQTVIDSLSDQFTYSHYSYSGLTSHVIRITGNVTSLNLSFYHPYDKEYRGGFISLDANRNRVLTSIRCENNCLTRLSVRGCTALETLNCSDNCLTNLDVSGCTALKKLYCGGNQLTNLDVNKNMALETLGCDRNQLTNLNVSGCTALKELYCVWNQLTNLNVSKNIALEDLHCNNNQLTSLDVSKNVALKNLSCDNDQLTSLDVSKNVALEYLHCTNSQLTSLDVSKNIALEDLYCNNNQLTSLDVSECRRLRNLNCSYNQVEGDALNALFESLPVSDKGVLHVDENPGSATCNRSIAKAKGWLVW